MKAAFFDLDGTLQDSEIVWVAATRDYVRAHGYPMTDEEALKIVYGRAWVDIREDLAALSPTLSEMDATTMANEARQLFYKRLKETPDISIPGSVALLRRLAKTMTVGIVSGSPRVDIESAIVNLKIGDEVSFFVCSEEYAHGKPDPTCYLMAAERAGVAPADCVVFEDSAAGVIAAKRAGMHCVALRLPGHPAQDISGADEIFSDLSLWNEKPEA
ncbi:MAG: HAD family phosphatase [Kiritimatiellae bacterium]|nr:HAD family phosphatase [Kiritimatiellia bacterium]